MNQGRGLVRSCLLEDRLQGDSPGGGRKPGSPGCSLVWICVFKILRGPFRVTMNVG